jgi:hypothetical protein
MTVDEKLKDAHKEATLGVIPKIINVAVLAVKPHVAKKDAINELMYLCQNVTCELDAQRMLLSLPAKVEILSWKLGRLKRSFETQEYFHYERVMGNGRTVWVTVKDALADPGELFARAYVILDLWAKEFTNAEIKFTDGSAITFDHRP